MTVIPHSLDAPGTPMRHSPVRASASVAVVVLVPLLAIPYLPARLAGLDASRLPKELALAAIATCALFILASVQQRRLSAGEWLLVAAVGSAAVSAAAATNAYLAFRATSISLCATVVAVALRRADTRTRLNAIYAMCLAATIAAGVGLAEAAHLVAKISLPSRGPGGVFLHRNAAAQFVALGLPPMWWAVQTTQSRTTRWTLVLATACLACFIVVSRCRGAWVAVSITFIALIVVTGWRRRRGDRVDYPRTAHWIAAIAVGVLLAIPLSREVTYTERNPLIATALRVLDIRSGSGLGRLRQMQHSVRMWQDAPLLGVGPGNWSVEYPRYAPPNDPSLLSGTLSVDSQPQSDYVGLVTEQGLLGVALITAAVLLLLRRLMDRTGDAVSRVAAAMTLLMALIMGAADAVVLTAAGAGAVAVIAAALVPRGPAMEHARVRRAVAELERFTFVAASLWVVGALAFLSRSALATVQYVHPAGVESFVRAARIAPWDYRAQMFVAAGLIERDSCEAATGPLDRAHTLEPYWSAPGELGAECDPPLVVGVSQRKAP